MLQFNPDLDCSRVIAEACMGTPIKSDFLNRLQPFPPEKFFLRIQKDNLAPEVYGHCYADNLAACTTMKRAYMTGRNIGVQTFSNGHEVMEFQIKLALPDWFTSDRITYPR